MTTLILINIWLIVGAVYIGWLYKDLVYDAEYRERVDTGTISFRFGVMAAYILVIIFWPVMMISRVIIHYGKGSE